MTGAVIQARMGSRRLPGKVLLKSMGKPLLGHLVDRLGYCATLDRIVVATSDHPRDDAIADYCRKSGFALFRGNETDVLDRYYRAAKHFELDVIVRVCSDCPLLDPSRVDAMVRFFHEHPGQYDLVTDRHPLTYPDACDVMSIDALGHAFLHAAEPHQREHVVPYFWEAGRRVYNIEHPEGLAKRYRWIIDYPEDFEVIDRLFVALHTAERPFSTENIVQYLDQDPALSRLNARYIE